MHCQTLLSIVLRTTVPKTPYVLVGTRWRKKKKPMEAFGTCLWYTAFHSTAVPLELPASAVPALDFF